MIYHIYDGGTYCTLCSESHQFPISFDGCGTRGVQEFSSILQGFLLQIDVVDQASSPTFVFLSPEEVIVPSYAAFAALVSLQLDTPPDIFSYPTPPTRLVDGAIDGLDLVPSLIWDDIWEIGGSKSLFRCQSRKVVRGGIWRGCL